jgi:hypothetical protein
VFVSRFFSLVLVNNPLALFRLLFSASCVYYKPYKQVLAPVHNLQCLFRLPIFDETRLVAFRKTVRQRNYTNWFLPVGQHESAHDIDSLHAVVKTIITKRSPKSDDAKF